MTVVWMMVGAVTDTSAVFSVKVTGGPVRIGVSTSESFTSPSYSASTTVDATKVAKVTFTGLSPATRYYWRVEDNGVVDATYTGQLLTDPVAVGQPASYVLGCIGDAGLTPVVPGVTGSAVSRLSNHPIFDTVREKALAENWARVCHLGDICYYDLGSGSHGLSASATATQYRTMWDDILAQPRQLGLYSSVPFVYIHDDHDFGPDNSNASSPGTANALTVYRERVPHYTLPASAGNPVYHSFTVGRVLHIVSDTRSARVPGSTMLGAAQLAWLDTLLSTSTAEALVWLMPTPWLGISSDTWAGFTSERDTIVQMLIDGGWTDRMIMINADAHTLAIDSGRGGNAGSGGFPVVLCAGLDATPHSYSTQYDSGAWPGRGQYATVSVHDGGGDICLTATVYRGERAISWVSVNTGGTTRVPAGNPCHVLAL
ncbi:alkaline phosphatase D family protein [Micromonospora haikouensis]|uniref:alkaline phosphatase D family protein n=1 Tax=Micromonospora haikouensis TaxID=686309 RepID=UPI003D714FF8